MKLKTGKNTEGVEGLIYKRGGHQFKSNPRYQ